MMIYNDGIGVGQYFSLQMSTIQSSAIKDNNGVELGGVGLIENNFVETGQKIKIIRGGIRGVNNYFFSLEAESM